MGTQFIQRNDLLDRDLYHTIILHGRDSFLIDGSVDNRSIINAVHGALTHAWKGPFVAQGMKGLGLDQTYCDDLDTKDFKNVVDYLITYGQDVKTLRRRGTAKNVHGVVVHCLQDIRLGKRPFETVLVPASHSVFSNGQSSQIANRIGLPLFSALLPHNSTWDRKFKNNNAGIVFTRMQCDVSDPDNWGWAPLYWQLNPASALFVRQDKAPLLAREVEALCSWCTSKLQSLFGEAMEYEGGIENGYAVEGGLTMEAVMAQVTKEGFDKHVLAMEGGAYGGFDGAGQN